LKEKEKGNIIIVKYLIIIMDREMFDFWIEGIKDVGYILMMEDDVPYYGVAS
jgi:hypothetical protein